MRTLWLVLLPAMIWGLISCSGVNPSTPGTSVPETLRDSRSLESNRWLWGNWKMYIPADHSRIEVTPLRAAEMHYNVKMLLENGPCDTCIWLSKFEDNGDGTVSVEVAIRHPYPGDDYYTGFDVRGIFQTVGHLVLQSFSGEGPIHGTISSVTMGDPELLNPDGFTNDYPPVNPGGWAPIFEYQPGGDLGAALDIDDFPPECGGYFWPFINYYSSEARRQFASNAVLKRTYHMALPPGDWEFGYTVDAVWAKPTKVPVTDIVTDFPIQANTLVPYRIDAFVSGPLVGQEPEVLTVRVYHHVPWALAHVDEIEVWMGSFSEYGAGGTYKDQFVVVDNQYAEFNLEFYNKDLRPPGRYPVMIHVGMTYEAKSYFHDVEKRYGRNSSNLQFVWVTIE